VNSGKRLRNLLPTLAD